MSRESGCPYSRGDEGMARKKSTNRNNRKKNNGSVRPVEPLPAEPMERSEIAAWLDTFCGLAGEVGDEDEGVSHLVVPEDYRGSVNRILSLIEKRERDRNTVPDSAGLAAHQLIGRLEEAGVAGLAEAAMSSESLGSAVQFALLDDLASFAVAEGSTSGTEGLRQVGHLLQDLAELLPDRPPEFFAQRFWELEPGHREILLRLLHEKTGEQVVPFFDLVCGRERDVDLQLISLAGTVASEAAAVLLLHLESETDDKQALKAVSKMLYSLRSRGVKGAEREPAAEGESASPIHFEEKVETRAFISGIDWQGLRLVLLAGLPGTRGFTVAQALLDDVRGIREFTVWKMSRADLREMIGRAQQRSSLLLCEVPADHAWYVLEKAFQTARPQGFDPPREFLHWRSSDAWPRPDHREYVHPVRALLPGDADNAAEPTGADWSRLLATDPLTGWTLGPDEAVKAYREVEDGVESAIIVPGAIQEERHQNAFREAVAARFDADTCRRYRHRLEETAYLLHLSGKSEEAGLALRAGDWIGAMEDRIWDHPLIAALVQRDLDLVARREKEAKDQDISLVRSPWEGGAGRT